MSKKVLMVLTNHGATESGAATGWYLPEAAHPHAKFVAAGYDVSWASVTGGDTTVAPSSLDMNDAENKAFWENADLKAKTFGTQALADCKGADYNCIFYVGGFGTMWDYYHADVDRVGRECYENGGVLGAVCHGPICFGNIKGSDGKLVIAGKGCTGFTEEEEAAVGLKSQLPMREGGQSCEEVLSKVANFSSVAAWGVNVVTDGRIVTGQNPASASATGAAVVAALSA